MNALTAVLVWALACMLALAWIVKHGPVIVRRARHSMIERSVEQLAAQFIFITPTRLAAAGAVLAVGTVLALLPWAGASVAIPLGLVVLAMPRVAVHFLRRRRLGKLRRQLPDAIALMAASLRAGSAIGQGLEQVATRIAAPLHHEFVLLLREHRLGVGLEGALASFARRVPLPEATLFATAITLSLQVGGALAPLFERLAESLRRRQIIEAKLDALTAQGRLQAWILTALPIALFAALMAIDPVAMRPLFETRVGVAVIALFVALEVSGWWLIRRIVAVDI